MGRKFRVNANGSKVTKSSTFFPLYSARESRDVEFVVFPESNSYVCNYCPSPSIITQEILPKVKVKSEQIFIQLLKNQEKKRDSSSFRSRTFQCLNFYIFLQLFVFFPMTLINRTTRTDDDRTEWLIVKIDKRKKKEWTERETYRGLAQLSSSLKSQLLDLSHELFITRLWVHSLYRCDAIINEKYAKKVFNHFRLNGNRTLDTFQSLWIFHKRNFGA